MSGFLVWILAIGSGVVVMLGLEALFRGQVPAAQILPLAQATGFVIAWVVAWPYARRTYWSNPKYVKQGFLWYLMAAVAPVYLMAALRIVLKTG
jgi:hypothetical protein